MEQHPVEDFWAMLRSFDGYPPDVRPVPELLPGTAAFAASTGLWRPPSARDLPPFPDHGLMIIGHNVDSRDGYEERRRCGVSHGDVVPGGTTMSTWRGLYKLLALAGIARSQFFFTNVFVGLKKGGPTGPFTAHKAVAYRRWCAEFLAHQVRTMRPRVVLVLGGPACRDIAAHAAIATWATGPLPAPTPTPAQLFGHNTMLVPAHHPSMQKRIARDAAALRLAWERG